MGDVDPRCLGEVGELCGADADGAARAAACRVDDVEGAQGFVAVDVDRVRMAEGADAAHGLASEGAAVPTPPLPPWPSGPPDVRSARHR